MRNEGGIVLSVAVELNIYVIAITQCVFMACLDAAAYAEVLGEVQDIESICFAYGFGFVRRPVVDDDIVVSCGNYIAYDRGNALLLVVRGDDYQSFQVLLVQMCI